MTNEHAAALGKLGHAPNTEAQREASRRNGRKGGRPPKYRCSCGATGDRPSRGRLRRYKLQFSCLGCGRKGLLTEILTQS